MQVNPSFVTAVVGVVAVLLGATAQYFFNQHSEAARNYRDLRTAAYVDFIRSAGGIAIAQRGENPEREAEFMSLMADAKARIAIYGSKLVVAATADFFRKHGNLSSPAALRSFAAIVVTMRSETPGGEESIPDQDIGQLLFSFDLQ